jgi:hypothetical protein
VSDGDVHQPALLIAPNKLPVHCGCVCAQWSTSTPGSSPAAGCTTSRGIPATAPPRWAQLGRVPGGRAHRAAGVRCPARLPSPGAGQPQAPAGPLPRPPISYPPLQDLVIPSYKPPRHYISSPLMNSPAKERHVLAFFRGDLGLRREKWYSRGGRAGPGRGGAGAARRPRAAARRASRAGSCADLRAAEPGHPGGQGPVGMLPPGCRLAAPCHPVRVRSGARSSQAQVAPRLHPAPTAH